MPCWSLPWDRRSRSRVFAWSGGTPSTPWLAIPPAEYFKWETLFVVPATLSCWILAAGVMHLLSRLCRGQGAFEHTLALLGFAIAVPTLVTLIPDAVHAVLTSFGVLTRMAWEQAVATRGSSDFVLILFPLAAQAAERLPRWPATGVGVAGAVVYQGVYLIFIR